MTPEKLTKIALELGWKDVGPQRNGMISFKRPGLRANFYETTGTLTIQNTTKVFDSGRTYKKVTEKEIREILK